LQEGGQDLDSGGLKKKVEKTSTKGFTRKKLDQGLQTFAGCKKNNSLPAFCFNQKRKKKRLEKAI